MRRISAPRGLPEGTPSHQSQCLQQGAVNEESPVFDFLGARLNPLTEIQLLRRIENAIDSENKCVFAHQNLHGLYIFHHDIKMRRLLTVARYVYIDGMSLILLGRLFGLPLKRTQRTTGIDFLFPLLDKAASQGWRVHFLGSKPGVGEVAAARLRERFPGLRLQTTHGYFDPAVESRANQLVVEDINSWKPHLLIVGMGMPRQEHWVLDNLESLNSNAVLCVGAVMDYVAGAIPTPPRWMSRIGLEWMYRLGSEPRRLWRRYLLEPWFICFLLLRNLLQRAQGRGEFS